MNMVVNQLFTDKNGNLLRSVFVNKVTLMVYVIEVDKNQFPRPMTFQEFEGFVQSKELQMVDEDNLVRLDADDDLSDVQRTKRDFAWEVVQYFFQMVEGEEYALVPRYRQEAIKLVCEEFNISYNTVKTYIARYWSGGGVRNSVLPRFSNCGAPGLERKSTDKKRGRPPNRDGNHGVNVDDNMKKLLKAGLNKHFYSTRQNSLKTAYELTLRDYFSSRQVRDDGTTYPVLWESSRLPTYAQFLYWARQWNDPKREITTRYGLRTYQQNLRTIIGNATMDADLGCSDLWEIDSTIFDIYLCSSLNRDVIVGRPRLLIVTDIYSRVITGVAVTFESLNAYSGAMVALASAMSSKVDYCAQYGIEITDEFPYCIPNRILADRGELVSDNIHNAIEQLGITVQQSPPYRADTKSVVEQMFHQINTKIKPVTDGVVVKGNRPKERGEIDYRLKANLTLEEFTTIVLKVIIFHNKHHVLDDYPLDESMIEAGVEKIPIKLWEHGLKHKKGQLRRLPPDTVRMALFPSGVATVGSRGISFKGLLYASQDTLRQGWFQRARTKGSWKIKVSYNPMDLTHIYVRDEDGLGVHKLTLLDHLKQYSFKSEQEVEQIQALERERTSQSKERELQEKIKLFAEIDSIVQDARVKTEAERDTTISKTKRLSNIKENQRNERELEREKMRAPRVEDAPSILTVHDDDGDELDLFRTVQEQNWGGSDGE